MGCKGEFEWCFLMDDDGDEKNNFLGGLVERWVDIMIMMTMMIYLAECGKSVLSIFMLVAMSLVTRLIFDAGLVRPHTLGIFIQLALWRSFGMGLKFMVLWSCSWFYYSGCSSLVAGALCGSHLA
jgi:hypothetical protein